MQAVYIETTIPSYLAAHPSGQQSIEDDQKATHDWWTNEGERFLLMKQPAATQMLRSDAAISSWPSRS